jgi:hypothetical protein
MAATSKDGSRRGTYPLGGPEVVTRRVYEERPKIFPKAIRGQVWCQQPR